MPIVPSSRRRSERLFPSIASRISSGPLAQTRLRQAAAAVVENLETRTLLAVTLPSEPGTYQVNLTVDASLASDTVGVQYRTLGAAIDYATSGSALGGNKSTKIFIKNGTYREALGKTLDAGGSTLLTIVGESQSGVVITGTSLYNSGWTEVSGQPGVWQHSWTPNFTMQDYDEPEGPNTVLSRRSELVFVNGQRLNQVVLERWNVGNYASYSYAGWAGFSDMKDYTFGVAELGSTASDAAVSIGGNTLKAIYETTGNTHGYANSIFVKLPAGVNPNTATTEVADLDNNGNDPGTGTALHINKDNVVLRNLTFKGYANAGHRSDNPVLRFGWDHYDGGPAVGQTINGQISQQYIRLQNVSVLSNANMGSAFQSIKHLSVENSTFKDNGMNGSSGGRMHEAQYIDSLWEGNNWRSDTNGAYYGWASANFKFYNSEDQYFLRSSFLNGYSNGLWFDGQGQRLIMEETWSINNKGFGYWNEIGTGPILYKNARAELNDVGLNISSRNVTVDGGIFANNERAQINVEYAYASEARVTAYAFTVFKPNLDTTGATQRVPGQSTDYDYGIRTGNVVVKNAYIATGMGAKSRLIGLVPLTGNKSGNFATDDERNAYFRGEYHGSNNTYYYTNADASKAFNVGGVDVSQSTFLTITGESGATNSATLWNQRPVYLRTAYDASGYAETGSWADWSDPWGDNEKNYYNGQRMRQVVGSETGAATATSTYTSPSIAVGGTYRVDTGITGEWHAAREVPFTIGHPGGSTTVKVDQTQPNVDFRWADLGTYDLTAGGTSTLRIDNAPIVQGGGFGNVMSQVARWVRMADTTRGTPGTPSAAIPAAPGAVTGVIAVAGSNKVTLSWTAATGSYHGYRIRYGVGGSGAYNNFNQGVVFAPASATSIEIPSLSSGVTYYFSVAAENGAGMGAVGTASATPGGSNIDRTTGGTAGELDTSDSYAASLAFDKNTSTNWVDVDLPAYVGFAFIGEKNTSYVSYTFPDSKAYVVTRFAVTSASDISSNTAQAPVNYQLEGSNDGGTTWSLVHVLQSSAVTTNSTELTVDVANDRAFKTYRLRMQLSTNVNPDDVGQDPTVRVSEVKFFVPDTAAASPDAFTDNFSSGTTLGSAWTTKNGAWAVSSGVAQQTGTANQDPKKAIVSNSGVSFGSNQQIVARVRVDSWAIGADQRAGVSLFSNTGDGQGYNLVFRDGNTVRLLDDGREWGASASFVWTTGTWYWMKLQNVGNTLYGKVWADGTTEPTAWTINGWTPSNTSRFTSTGAATGYASLNGGSHSTTVSFDDVTVSTVSAGTDTTAPTSVNNTGTSVTQGVTGTAITGSMLKYTDNVSAASAVTYTLTTLPGKGTLKKSGTALALNGTFTQDDLDNNRITYDNTSNPGNDSFAFTVRDAASNAASSATFSITVNKLAAPGSFTLTAGDGKITVNWATVSGATGYRVKYGTSSGSYGTIVDVSGGASTSKEITSLTNGTTYYFVVLAYNAAGDGNSTSESSKAPSASGASLISNGKSATASSQESTSHVPGNAFDGSLSSRWASQSGSDNQWIYVDLGSSYNVSQIRLYWETAAGKDYKLQIKAADPDVDTGWTDLKSVTGNTTANSWLDYTGLSGTGRYVRMRGTLRATGWGYSLYEFEVYGTAAVAATPAKLSGTVMGTTGSWNNEGNTRDKAFDGDLNSFFDAPTGDGNWVGLDLGSAKTITSIKFAPRSGFASRMVGGYFQVSNSADFSSATTIHTISTTPTVGSLTSVTVSVEGTWRYIRFVSPTGGYGNIAELEAWGY